MKKYLIIFITIFCLCTQDGLSKEFSTHKLPSGQTLIIKEIHDNPIVTIDTWIKTGSIDEDDSNNGVAHFLEHMFFKGTTKYPTGQFDRILESKGAVTNAATSKDFTHYYIITPSKYFDTALELHSDMLLNPLLPRNELEMERKVVLEEMARGNDNPDSLIYKKMNALLYSQHPYKRDVIGKAEVIENIPREKMLEFYNNNYKTDNMITIIVGDVNTNEVIKDVEKNFKTNLAGEKTKKIKYKKDKVKTNIPNSITNMDTETGYLLIGFRGVEPKNQKDSAALDLLSTILGNGQSSRLYQNIQEEKQLTTSIYAGHSSLKEDSIFFIKAKFDPKKQADVEAEIWNEIFKLEQNPVPEQELQKAKNIIKHDTYYTRESSSNIAEEMGYMTVLTNKPSFYNNYLKTINKVTPKDISRVLNKYIVKEKSATAYIMPKGMDIQKKEVLSSNNEQKARNSLILPQKTYPEGEAKLISANGNTKKYELNNGLTLIITQNTNNDIVSINMLSKGGYFQEQEIRKGTGNLLTELLMKETKNYSSAEINNFFDENGIEISSSIQPDAFSTSIKTTSDELNNALIMFDEIINNAVFKDDNLKNAIDKKLQKIKTSKDIPSNIAFDEMKYLLWENTPYQNSSKVLEKAYAQVTVNDIKNLYSQIYYPQNTIISINGNVDEKYLINYFSDVFKEKKAKKYNLSDYQNKIYPMVKNKSNTIQKGSNEAWVVIAYRTPSIANMKDRATLKVIDSLLGTGMSSRLFTTLRDKQGLAYTVGSIYQSNILQGLFLTYIGTNPNTVDKAQKGMEEQIDILKRNFVSSKELDQAKDRILGNFILSQETNSEKAHTLSAFELQGLGYDFEKEYFKYINAVTEQDIIEAANKYFSEPSVTIIVK